MQSQNYSELINSSIQTSLRIINDNNDWKLQKQGKYLSIFAKKYELSFIFKVEGKITSNIDEISHFYFENNEGMAKNRQSCTGVEVLENVDKNTLIYVIRAVSISTNSPVEFLSIKNRSQVNGNEILIVNGNLDDHTKLQRDSKVARSGMAINTQLIKQISQNSSQLVIYFLHDPKVPIEETNLPQSADALLNIYEKDIESILSKN